MIATAAAHQITLQTWWWISFFAVPFSMAIQVA
jgi:hypothetical protein